MCSCQISETAQCREATLGKGRLRVRSHKSERGSGPGTLVSLDNPDFPLRFSQINAYHSNLDLFESVSFLIDETQAKR